MTLKEWKLKRGFRTLDIAVLLGITDSGVARIVAGNRYPSPTLARKIIAVSKGEITWEDLYGKELLVVKPAEGKVKKKKRRAVR